MKGHIVKIGDFGLAVSSTEYIVTSRFLLPLHWLPPESFPSNRSVFSAKSDV